MIGPKKLIAMIAAHFALLPLTDARSRMARSVQAEIARADCIEISTMRAVLLGVDNSFHDFFCTFMRFSVPDVFPPAPPGCEWHHKDVAHHLLSIRGVPLEAHVKGSSSCAVAEELRARWMLCAKLL